jgi:hypothetical protein
MQGSMRLPVAFSVRDEHEFFPMLHVMRRMNPKLVVTQVVAGRHVNGDCTVLWGLVDEEGQPSSKDGVKAALREAGFDFRQKQRVPSLISIPSQASAGDGRKRREPAGV